MSSPKAEYKQWWWRSTEAFREYWKIKNDKSNKDNIISQTPRLRVMTEMERLQWNKAKCFYDVRNRLLSYKAGDFCAPTGGIKKEDLDIPSTNTILLVGFTGSGKTSLVNLMYSLHQYGAANPQHARGNAHKTLYMEEHNVQRSENNGFCVYDSRGFDYDKVEEAMAELSYWTHNGVHHNQPPLKSSYGGNGKLKKRSSEYIRRGVNYVMFVVDIAGVYRAFKAGDSRPLLAIKKLFCSVSIKNCDKDPMVILTHGDILTPDERLEGRLKICECLGVSETNDVYDIACFNYGFTNSELDWISAYALEESLINALSISDKSHRPKSFLWRSINSAFLRGMCALAS